jgi:formylmethanofuran dehydrogenase subunit C
MTLHLRYLARTTIPVEVEGVVPNLVRDLPLSQVERLPLFHGNQQLPLAEFFAVSGDPSDGRIEWEGDLAGVHWIGAKMTDGSMHVAGDAGRHLGSEMQGGEIHVDGSASDWVGGEMHGGTIHVRGRAGHLVGAAYRGSSRGMTGGIILIGGEVGNEVGHTMRRGLIAVGGNAGDLVGFNMLAGSIFVFGDSGIRHGAGMRRGTIGFFGPTAPPLLPSFRHACRYRPEILQLVFRQLRGCRFRVPEEVERGQFDLYNGDLIEGGRGEILIRVAEKAAA